MCEYGTDVGPGVRIIPGPGRVMRTGFGVRRFECGLGIETMIGLAPGT